MRREPVHFRARGGDALCGKRPDVIRTSRMLETTMQQGNVTCRACRKGLETTTPPADAGGVSIPVPAHRNRQRGRREH